MYNVSMNGLGTPASLSGQGPTEPNPRQLKCAEGHVLIRVIAGDWPMVGCMPTGVVKMTPMMGGKGTGPYAVLPKDATSVMLWEKSKFQPYGGSEQFGWQSGYHILNSDLSKMTQAQKATLAAPPTPTSFPPGISISPSIPRKVRVGTTEFTVYVGASTPGATTAFPCGAGYTQGETYDSVGWVPTCIKTTLVPVGAVGTVIPMIGPGVEPILKEVVTVEEKKKGLPVWAWGLIFGGGGLVVGGALIGIGVAVSRKKD
jgi:hypothetical protein